MPIVVYGIRNCNTVKTALQWLNDHKVDFEFHDYKSKGIAEATLKKWCAEIGWENLLNRRGTTWRQLDASTQAKITNQSAAIALMKEKTSIIRRPLLESDGKVLTVGFDAPGYSRLFAR